MCDGRVGPELIQSPHYYTFFKVAFFEYFCDDMRRCVKRPKKSLDTASVKNGTGWPNHVDDRHSLGTFKLFQKDDKLSFIIRKDGKLSKQVLSRKFVCNDTKLGNQELARPRQRHTMERRADPTPARMNYQPHLSRLY